MKWVWVVLAALFMVLFLVQLFIRKETGDLWASAMVCYAMFRIEDLEENL